MVECWMVINVQARNFIVSLLVFCFLDTDFPVLYQNLTLVLACPLHVSFYFFWFCGKAIKSWHISTENPCTQKWHWLFHKKVLISFWLIATFYISTETTLIGQWWKNKKVKTSFTIMGRKCCFSASYISESDHGSD